MRLRLAAAALALTVLLAGAARAEDPLARALGKPGWIEKAGEKIENVKDGKEAFRAFAEEAALAAGKSSPPHAAWLAALAKGDAGAPAPEGAWSVLLPRYAAARYGRRLVWTTQKLVVFETVNAPEGGGPKGSKAFRDMEAHLATLSKELGLQWRNHDFEAWTARTGERPDSVTAVTHADVVPAGDGKWTHPPFKAAIAEDALWGRGALDDKGPIAAHLYAMRALLDAGLPMSRDAELLIGLDEETSWAGFKAHLAKRGAPKTAYVADAYFPVVVGEKGVMNVAIAGGRRAAPPGSPASVFRLEGFRAGQAPNVVPGEARATVSVSASTLAAHQVQSALDGYIIKFNRAFPGVTIDYEWEGNSMRLAAHGASAHGARPWEGKNAAGHLLKFCESYLKMDAYAMGDVAYWAATRVGASYDGRGMGVFMRDLKMGEATASLGVLRTGEEGGDRAAVNVRWPVGKTSKEIAAAIRSSVAAFNKETGASLAVSTSYEFDPILVDEDSPLVRTLLDVYHAQTDGLDAAIVIEGNTYAKAIPGAVSFGPNFEGSGLAIHGEDERIPLEHLRRLLEIYTDALYRLTR